MSTPYATESPITETDDDCPATDASEAWGRRALDQLEGTALEWSTVDEESGRARNTKRKQCL